MIEILKQLKLAIRRLRSRVSAREDAQIRTIPAYDEDLALLPIPVGDRHRTR